MNIVLYHIDQNQDMYHVLYKQEYDQVEIEINNHLVINEKLKKKDFNEKKKKRIFLHVSSC